MRRSDSLDRSHAGKMPRTSAQPSHAQPVARSAGYEAIVVEVPPSATGSGSQSVAVHERSLSRRLRLRQYCGFV